MERLGLGDGEALDRTERDAPTRGADCLRAAVDGLADDLGPHLGRRLGRGGGAGGVVGGGVARGERDGGEGAEGDDGHPGGDLMA